MKVKPITITTEDNRIYTLEFDRASVCYAEEHGFDINEVARTPMTGIYKLIYFAMRKHHPFMKYEKVMDFVDENFGGVAGLPEGFAERLGELYSAPFGDSESKNPKTRVDM